MQVVAIKWQSNTIEKLFRDLDGTSVCGNSVLSYDLPKDVASVRNVQSLQHLNHRRPLTRINPTHLSR